MYEEIFSPSVDHQVVNVLVCRSLMQSFSLLICLLDDVDNPWSCVHSDQLITLTTTSRRRSTGTDFMRVGERLWRWFRRVMFTHRFLTANRLLNKIDYSRQWSIGRASLLISNLIVWWCLMRRRSIVPCEHRLTRERRMCRFAKRTAARYLFSHWTEYYLR